MMTIVICCATSEDVSYTLYNIFLTHKLNIPANLSNVRWVIINNGGNKLDRTLKKIIDRNNIRIIRGVKPPDVIDIYKGSYHHGAALNKALSSVKTRFLLILDPDFFIVRKNWVKDIIEYIISKKLEFFGVPWHPRYFTKYRYFPSVHCLFIDLEKVNISEFNFLPSILENCTQRTVFNLDEIMSEKSSGLSKHKSGGKNNIKLMSIRLIRGFIKDWQDRFLIGTSHDTGYLLYKKFKNTLTETITPYYKVNVRNLLPEGVF